MKIRLTLKQVLLILFASTLTSCLQPKEKDKGVEYNSYTEQIEENHLLIRDELRQMSDSFYNYQDTAMFMEKVMSLMMKVDASVGDTINIPITHFDSLVYASEVALSQNYQNILGNKFLEMFDLMSKTPIDSAAIDSIKDTYYEEDRRALKYFKKTLNKATELTELE